jgi:pimeloyl-ACP methyl ester carboxylesterase
MEAQISIKEDNKQQVQADLRGQLLAELPVKEKKLQLGGIPMTVLEGGEGIPVILLHGPGESAVWWMRVIPDLVKIHKLIIPDLPGHGTSVLSENSLNPSGMTMWLEDLIKQTCQTPPVLVGHLLGGAIAARFAISRGNLIRHLVLADSFGLGKFRPSPKFAFNLIWFFVRPTEKNYTRFMPQCIFDVDNLYQQMGNNWKLFMQYNLAQTRDPKNKAAIRVYMRQFALHRIPDEDLTGINVPTALIWGRYDKALKLDIAKKASERFGWPLHVIEEARDDPKLEQPEAFINALHEIIEPALEM